MTAPQQFPPRPGTPEALIEALNYGPGALALMEAAALACVSVSTLRQALLNVAQQYAEPIRQLAETLTALYVPSLLDLQRLIEEDRMIRLQREARRAQRAERKARRHAFLTRGKHGLRRPKGKRNVPRGK